jgi:hypothetical protein
MHEARHTAITEFPRRSGNLKLTQSSPATPTPARLRTSNAHLDTTDLETALRLNEEI